MVVRAWGLVLQLIHFPAECRSWQLVFQVMRFSERTCQPAAFSVSAACGFFVTGSVSLFVCAAFQVLLSSELTCQPALQLLLFSELTCQPVVLQFLPAR